VKPNRAQEPTQGFARGFVVVYDGDKQPRFTHHDFYPESLVLVHWRRCETRSPHVVLCFVALERCHSQAIQKRRKESRSRSK
jgi:hypothetical protein